MRTILINGHLVEVRNNLYVALLQFRTMERFKRGLKLWVDAITINQNHKEEKTAQILIMYQIYQRAGNIIVWVGTDVEPDMDEDGKAVVDGVGNPVLSESKRWDVHRTIGVLEEISSYHESSVYEALDNCGDLRKAHQHREAVAFRLREALRKWKEIMHENPDFFNTYTDIYEFFNRDYWRRLWVIQELAMGNPGMPIVCGNRVTHWREIRDAAMLLYTAMDVIGHMTTVERGEEETVDTRGHTAGHVAGIAQLEMLSHRKALPWVDKSTFELRSTPGIGGGEAIRGSALDQALQLAMEADCEKPEDRVFGMIHIHGVPDVCKRYLNYTDPPAQIYQSFAKSLLQLGKVEIFALLGGCSDALKLPSWVPNFARPASRRTNPIHGPWFAGGFDKFDVLNEQTLLSLPGVYEIGGKEVLLLYGVTLVDVIDGVGAMHPLLTKRIQSSSSGFAIDVVQPSMPKPKANPLYELEHVVKRGITWTLTCGTDLTGHQREYPHLLSCFAPDRPEPTDPDRWNWDFIDASKELMIYGKSLSAWLEPYVPRPTIQYSTEEHRKSGDR